MACPLFLPQHAIADYYGGFCAGQTGVVIADLTLRRCCNRGYARACCEVAAGAEADAIQVLVKSVGEGSVEVAWSLERNHHPLAVGVMSVSPGQAGSTPLEFQAIALAAAYGRQKENSV